ncbi:MAG: hypothetical protein HY287_15295 [Planctomycetes bacterium]|nr:hypothetical protein [Planctomycetota bacterium]MBI3835689.1 hypothetical protein [Planctomycetota bacterium]
MQRDLVAKNIGLVGVHLRHHTGFLTTAQRQNQWSDFFQEGCLGLIRAVATYGENNPIPFAAWALRRIHMYVSRAMLREREAAHASENIGFLLDESAHARVRRHSIARLCATQSIESLGADDLEMINEPPPTIGERLREKYERAAHHAARMAQRRATERGDREVLVRILMEERFLVPDEHSRGGLRQIARDTDSSFARVLHCERQMASAIRNILQADPEFVELQRQAKENLFGVAMLIDNRLEARLAATCTLEFARRLHRVTPEFRSALLERLWAKCANELSVAAARIFVRLPWQDREEVLQPDAA